MYKKHREVLEVETAQTTELPHEPMDTHDTDPFSAVDDPGPQSNADGYNMKEIAALFLMKAKTVHKVSQCVLDELIGDISLLLDRRVESLQEEIHGAIERTGIEMSAELSLIFRRPSITAPFDGLQTEFLRRKFYKERMGLLVSPVL